MVEALIRSLVFANEVTVKYRSTWISVIVGMVFASSASLLLRWSFVRENRRRDSLTTSVRHCLPLVRSDEQTPRAMPAVDTEKLVSERHVTAPLTTIDEYQDLTDKHRPEFRYSL